MDTTTQIPVSLLIEPIQKVLEKQKASLAEWGKKFADDPVYALGWAENVYKDGAEHYISGRMFGALEYLLKENPEATITSQWFIDIATKELLNAATSIGGSSSVSSNHLEKCKVECLAMMARGDYFGNSIMHAFFDVLWDYKARQATYVAYREVDVKEGRKVIGKTKMFYTGEDTFRLDANQAAARKFSFDETQSAEWMDWKTNNKMSFEKVAKA